MDSKITITVNEEKKELTVDSVEGDTIFIKTRTGKRSLSSILTSTLYSSVEESEVVRVFREFK